MNVSLIASPFSDVAPVESIARRCGALSEPIRITLLDALRASANTIDELQQATGAGEQEILRHLKVLLDAGLVSAVPVGSFLRYVPIRDSMPCGYFEQHPRPNGADGSDRGSSAAAA
jgi:hypothetical protein